MFFNRSLLLENQKLKEKLHALTQVRESLDLDMLGISLDPRGQVVAVNEKFCSELNLSENKVLKPTYHRTGPGICSRYRTL